MTDHPAVRILVLHYSRRDLLERFLPSVVKAAAASPYPCAVTVIDNHSTDDSVDYVRKNFASVEVYVASANRVLCSFNEAAAHYTEPILILLNNDIQLEEGFVEPLVRMFREHSDAFFVSTYGDRSIPVWRWGLLGADIYYEGFEKTIVQKGLAFTAGVCAVDRQKFLDLGGYDPMYLPGYYEDMDLCYRAWRRGMAGYYAPDSRQYHVGSASFDQVLGRNRIHRLSFRNSLLFMLKNVTNPWWLLRLGTLLLCRLVLAMLRGQWFLVNGFVEAVRKIPEAIEGRRRETPKYKVSDREIVARLTRDVRASL
jgi:N-acetylglucosaminyl-diphospho-decaprenol L-rhamnosyltransferase